MRYLVMVLVLALLAFGVIPQEGGLVLIVIVFSLAVSEASNAPQKDDKSYLEDVLKLVQYITKSGYFVYYHDTNTMHCSIGVYNTLSTGVYCPEVDDWIFTTIEKKDSIKEFNGDSYRVLTMPNYDNSTPAVTVGVVVRI